MSATVKLVAELEEMMVLAVQRISELTFEELAAISDQRERLVLSLISYQDDLDVRLKQRLRKLGEYDSIIIQQMNRFKQEASDWLLKRESIRIQRNAYHSGYNTDSMFLDCKN